MKIDEFREFLKKAIRNSPFQNGTKTSSCRMRESSYSRAIY